MKLRLALPSCALIGLMAWFALHQNGMKLVDPQSPSVPQAQLEIREAPSRERIVQSSIDDEDIPESNLELGIDPIVSCANLLLQNGDWRAFSECTALLNLDEPALHLAFRALWRDRGESEENYESIFGELYEVVPVVDFTELAIWAARDVAAQEKLRGSHIPYLILSFFPIKDELGIDACRDQIIALTQDGAFAAQGWEGIRTALLGMKQHAGDRLLHERASMHALEILQQTEFPFGDMRSNTILAYTINARHTVGLAQSYRNVVAALDPLSELEIQLLEEVAAQHLSGERVSPAEAEAALRAIQVKAEHER